MARVDERFYEEAALMDDLVWKMCEYIRDLKECKQCPRWFMDEHYGMCQMGCRAFAEEAVAIVLEAKAVKG